MPGLGGRGRAHGLGDQRHAAGIAAGGARRPPGGHVLAADTHAREQFPHSELGMGVIERVPARLVHVSVQPGQHHGALGQARDHTDKLGGCRDASRRARRDHGFDRRRLSPARGQRLEQAVAALGRIIEALLREHPRPVLGDDLQEVEGDLPVPGVVLGHQLGEPIEAEPLGLDLVQKARQVGGKLGGLGRVVSPIRPALLELQDQPGEKELAAERRDGRRQFEGFVRAAGERRLEKLGPEARLVGVDVAQGPHRR